MPISALHLAGFKYRPFSFAFDTSAPLSWVASYETNDESNLLYNV